ncbi:hypothetical protein [Actinoplanes sp. NPDC051494]|uniref:hypothetical protein n=1 Tax=Actinoplanes sp. NPDC051494 TaxID=3363907 RepID=UPI0037A81F40
MADNTGSASEGPIAEGGQELIRKFLSEPRFQRYRRDCAGDDGEAWRLYWWNVEVSSAFYPALHCLEIALRNAFHEALASHHGRGDWWNAVTLPGVGTRMVEEATEKLRRSLPQPGADDVVAALTFGFWVSLLSRSNEVALWRPALYRVFRPGYRGPRGEMHRRIEHLRLFRNRIMHHEPIYWRRLVRDRSSIYDLVENVVPEMGPEMRRIDPLPGVLARNPLRR